jgi:hypothetical protein
MAFAYEQTCLSPQITKNAAKGVHSPQMAFQPAAMAARWASKWPAILMEEKSNDERISFTT